MSGEQGDRGDGNVPNLPQYWDELPQEERESLLERALRAAKTALPSNARTLSSLRKRLTYDHVATGSIILLPTDTCTESVRRKLKTLPSPLPGHMAFRLSDFAETCRKIGLNAKRVSLNPARGYDRCFIGDPNGAWLPPAALWRMSQWNWRRTADRLPDSEFAAGTLERLKSALAEKVVRLQEFEARAIRIRNALLNGGETGREYDRILGHPDVVGLKVEGKEIHVLTGLICIKHKRHTYRVGDFKIVIDTRPEAVTEGNTYGIRMHNLTDRKGSCDHPHVERGIPCLGNVKTDLKRLLQNRQFEAVAALCIRYLHTYTHVMNEDETYRPFIDIDNWK